MRRLETTPPPPQGRTAPLRPAHAPVGEEHDLRRYLDVLNAGRGWLVGVTLAVLLVGVLYALAAPPVYRSTVVLQVEEKAEGLTGLMQLLTAGGPEVSAEMQLLNSRSLLRKVIDELRLDVRAEPRRVPLVGTLAARAHGDGPPARAPPGLGRYGWGGERLRLDRLAVPPELEDVPLTLVAGEGGSYRLLDRRRRTLLDGQVGALARGEAGRAGGVQVQVSELVARPGTEFRVTKRSRLAAEESLQRALKLGERGEGTGIIAMSLEGRDPHRIAEVLDAIARNYVQQNIERRSEEATKTLAFLESQLPTLRGELQRAESSLSAYQSKRGSIDLGMKAKAILDRSVELEKELSQAGLDRSQLRQRFTENHPEVLAATRKLGQLQAERNAIQAELKRLPAAESQSAQLMRDVKVANELYLMLSNKAQEFRVMKSGTVANVRVIDEPSVPRTPVRPHRVGALLVSLVLGLALGAAVVFTRRAINNSVLDPGALEAGLGLPVYANIPLSEAEQHRGQGRRGGPGAGLPLLAAGHARDLAVESLRSLRTSLQFALMEAPNNRLSITGPSPGVGKSFVAANLAWVLADLGKRVLLVDADLRAGALHRAFSTERANGLSEAITGATDVAYAVRRTPHPGLFVLPTGVLPPNPSELLQSERFMVLLERLSTGFDLVVLDTPPILAVADAAIVGRLAGVNLMVVRAGRHPLREISLALNRLEQNGVLVQGLVFNGVPRWAARRGLNGIYQYEYPGVGGWAPAGATP